MRKFHPLLFCLWLASLAVNADDAAFSAIPGGILDLKIPKKSAAQPLVRYGLQEVLTLETKNQWRVLAGIPLDTLPGDYLISIEPVSEEDDDYHLVFSVQQRQYNNNDEGENQTTYAKPKTILSNLTTLGFDHSEIPEFPFEYPTSDEWNGDFGKQFQNLALKNTGTSAQQTFISQTMSGITAVHTPQKGIISNQWKSDNDMHYIAISHGRGVYSVLAGLDEVIVNIGDGLHKGALIGKITPSVGKTNNRLHWYAVMNNTFINPTIVTKLID